MSTRHLRRVYGNDVINIVDHEDISDVSIARDEKSKCFNVFNLLNEKDDCSENSDENETAAKNERIGDSKRNKKKKTKKNKIEKLLKIQDDDSDENSQNVDNVDEIERTVREINKLLGEPVPCSSKANEDSFQLPKVPGNILIVQHRYLNAANELRRICGSKIMPSENRNSRRRGRIGLKKFWLTSRTAWFPAGKFGLSMVTDDTIKSDETQYFIYTHNSHYRQIQMKFFDAVESQNPENIVNIVKAHPCNVDALLQFSDICKLNEDLQLSAKFVERAVYCLECVFHPLFNITNGNCRLSYKHQANRALFIALFKHLTFIGGRACNRTSLELCKLLMSLDPDDDPLAIVLVIDFYALRAREYQWFIDFCKCWEAKKNLTQLPNIAYSLALAHFHVGNHEVANELLQNALIMFPGVLFNLLDKCGVETDMRVLGHDHFGVKAKVTTSITLEKLQDLYVVRTYYLWKEAAQISILPWLEGAAHAVMDRVDVGDEFTKFCQVKRIQRYQGQPPRNILRHIILSDIKEVTVNHPEVQNEEAIFSYDPFPPADSIDIYDKRETIQRPVSSHPNFFTLFISSLFTDLNGIATNAMAINHDNAYEANESSPEFD